MRNNQKGITLIALVVTIIVLLILAAVSISMLTGDNGIIKNASQTSSANAYYSAEEQVKLAYMAVKTEIMAQTVKDGKYDPTKSADTTALAAIVAKELTGSKWAVVGTTAGEISITYTDSKIDKDSLGTVNLEKLNGNTEVTQIPREEGVVHYKIKLLASQDAKLYLDVKDDTEGAQGPGNQEPETPATASTTITPVTGSAITITSTTTQNDVKSLYGTKVQYTPDSLNSNLTDDAANTFRLFYIVTEDNSPFGARGTIFLKADCGTKTVALNNSNAGGSTAPTTFGSEMADVRAALNHDWATTGAADITTLKTNGAYVSWMLDPANWTGYRDLTHYTATDYNYVVGGPSVELFCASYSAKYPSNTHEAGYVSPGYQIGINGGTKANSTSSNTLTDTDSHNMYNPGSGKYYWLASPSAGDATYVMYVNGGNSRLGNYGYNRDLGLAICPLVSLKSGVGITLVSES